LSRSSHLSTTLETLQLAAPSKRSPLPKLFPMIPKNKIEKRELLASYRHERGFFPRSDWSTLASGDVDRNDDDDDGHGRDLSPLQKHLQLHRIRWLVTTDAPANSVQPYDTSSGRLAASLYRMSLSAHPPIHPSIVVVSLTPRVSRHVFGTYPPPSRHSFDT